jgi:hypothetical protein
VPDGPQVEGQKSLGKQDAAFEGAYCEQTVGKVRPKLLIPIHRDDFFSPLSGRLEAPLRLVGDLQGGFYCVIRRARRDGIAFKILQGYRSALLFADGTR